MASSFALGCELRSIILKGYQRLHDIEIVRNLSEFVLLESRMVVAAALYADDIDEWAPSPDDIRAACNVIQSSWSDEERELRARFEYTSTRLKRQEADFAYQKAKDGPTNPRDAADCKKYRERHRERIAAQSQDPAFVERRRERHRLWRERNSLRLKEYRAARLEKNNAERRAKLADPERREALKERRRAYYAANRETIREQQNEANNANREERNARVREQRAANAEQINARRRELRATRRMSDAHLNALSAERRAVAAC